MSAFLHTRRCCLGLAILFANAPAAAQTAPVEDSVRALEAVRREAILRADTATLASLIAPEFVEIGPGGEVFTKRDHLQAVAGRTLALSSIALDSLVVHIHANTAILRGIVRSEGSIDGNPLRLRARYVRIFVRRDGRWQAVLQQFTRMAN